MFLQVPADRKVALLLDVAYIDFAGDEDEPLISQDLFVNAWMPLPKPYKPKEEVNENDRA